MRCVGEIDISRPRWSERPAALAAVILGHVENSEPGAGRRRFAQGRQDALATARDVLERLRALPDGERKARDTELMIDRLRTFTGYREFPKFAMISRYQIYRRALLDEADHLVADGVLGDRDDIYYLRFDELHEVARTRRVDDGLLRERRQAFARYQTLTPPRVLTSTGEAVVGEYRSDRLPPGALAGLPVSRGTVEGRARIVRDIAEADLEPGDILVTAFTDPSWSPAFVAAAGLVTEVGGTMTHGAVVAREYGLPAVVGVEGATRRLRDGQRIRVDGTNGWVEVLT
jgi:pyruvate,water dikinase